MKYFELTKEEKKILKGVESGHFAQVDEVEKAKKRAVAAARNTLSKTKNINIRIAEKDLLKLKAKAIKEGLPYQTLVSSILHRSATE